MQGEVRGIAAAVPACTAVPVATADVRVTFSSFAARQGDFLATAKQSCECVGTRTSAAAVAEPLPNHRLMDGFNSFEAPTPSASIDGGSAEVSSGMLVVVGHRGCGKNKSVPEAGMSSIRENTITSFNLAARNGAQFVEFDVQVTKDGVPIIFHDDVIITEDCLTGRHIGDLTLDEFRAIGPQRSPAKVGQALYRRGVVGSMNLWTVDVEDSMCTLSEAFKEVVPSVGFNIELKFDDDGLTSDEELNRVIDATVAEVKSSANGRMIYFSSFHPDAVHILRQKFPVYPVFYLTDGGTHLYKDERRNSIEAAIEVCRKGCLQGIVTEVKAVLQQPSCVALVKAAGLFFFTYGELNNVGEAVLQQQNWGIDGVIVDHVLEMVRVARHLHESEAFSDAPLARRSVSVVTPEVVIHKAKKEDQSKENWKQNAMEFVRNLMQFLSL